MEKSNNSDLRKKIFNKVAKILVFFVILGLGFGVYKILVSTKSEPKRAESKKRSAIVRTVPAAESKEQVFVRAMGKVIPARSVTILPEVAGKIIYTNPALIPGASVRKGETLVRIDPRDYDLAIKQYEAALAQARLQLATERSRKRVAEKEWKLLEHEVQPTEDGRKLALREIQMESAKAAMVSAQSNLEIAKLRRERSVIRAPFNALVVEKFTDVGQVVGAGSKIANLVAANRFWIRVSLPADKLEWIRIPGINVESDDGSAAEVSLFIGNKSIVKKHGKVIQLLGGLDVRGKMAQLLISVDNPLSSNSENQESMLPLFLEATVQVRIEGIKLENVFSLPRLVLRDDNKIWIKTEDGKLEIRQTDVVWTTSDRVFVKNNISAGEEVIVSRISTAVEGMLVNLAGEPDPNDTKTEEPQKDSALPLPDKQEARKQPESPSPEEG